MASGRYQAYALLCICIRIWFPFGTVTNGVDEALIAASRNASVLLRLCETSYLSQKLIEV